jgi:PAS domain S-box-containing protein
MENHEKTKSQLIEELTAHKAILEAIVESLPFDFFAIGPDGRYLAQNAASKTHWGEAVGKYPEDVADNQETLAVWQENNRRAFAGERIEEEVEFTIQGEKRFYNNVIAPIREAGHIRGILGVNLDVTERKRAEAVLRHAHDELEARVRERTAALVKANEDLAVFRRLADGSSQGFGIADMDGLIQYSNPAMCRLDGAGDQEERLGKNFLAIMPAETRKIIEQEGIPATLRDGRWTGEVPMLSPTGERLLTFQNASLIRDEQGNPYRIAVIVTDITAQKEAEAKLQQNRDELQAIYDGMVDGVLIADSETKRFVRANASICKMLGYSEDELLSMSIVDIHPAEVLPGILAAFQAGLEGRVHLIDVAPVLRRDGRVFHADIRGKHIVYAGRPCVIGFFRDITERKQAQAALAREHQTLKHLLQSSDHERQVIAYEIHDGLAQQLAGAIMQFQTYAHLKETKPKDAARAYDAATTMLGQAHFEARRLISGVRPPILDESGVAAAVAHLVNEQRLENGPTIELLSDVEFTRLAPILENAVYRIVQEGLNNACKHSKSPRVRVELVQHGDRLHIKVRDWGVGFQPAEIEEGRFGLHGIRERARLLGGNAAVASTPGKGTSVAVELPLALGE